MKTSIYLPDDLAGQVRVYGISISEVTRAALRKAVRVAVIQESVMTDIHMVVQRLRGTVDQAVVGSRERGRRDGIRWAREYATASELAQLARRDGSVLAVGSPHTLVGFVDATRGRVPPGRQDRYGGAVLGWVPGRCRRRVGRRRTAAAPTDAMTVSGPPRPVRARHPAARDRSTSGTADERTPDRGRQLCGSASGG